MQNIINVSFRNFNDYWEAYGINIPVHGYGDSLSSVKADIQDALCAYFEVDSHLFELNEFQERRVYKGNGEQPDVWVRCFMDHDSARMLRRRNIADLIEQRLKDQPGYLRTFDNGRSSLGDVIATVSFEDDMLVDLIDQIGDTDLIYVCMPAEDGLYWNCIFTPSAEGMPIAAARVSDLGLGDAATVGQFMHLTTQHDIAPKNYLASAKLLAL